MKPPYSITPAILQSIGSIAEKIGEINASHLQLPKTELRKSNRIKTIHSSLGIEGNTLNIEQVTALLDNKKVVAPKKDILEVKNAIKVYDQLEKFERKDYLRYFKEISPATASRDLKKAVDNGSLKKIGDRRTTTYQFIKAIK